MKIYSDVDSDLRHVAVELGLFGSDGKQGDPLFLKDVMKQYMNDIGSDFGFCLMELEYDDSKTEEENLGIFRERIEGVELTSLNWSMANRRARLRLKNISRGSFEDAACSALAKRGYRKDVNKYVKGDEKDSAELTLHELEKDRWGFKLDIRSHYNISLDEQNMDALCSAIKEYMPSSEWTAKVIYDGRELSHDQPINQLVRWVAEKNAIRSFKADPRITKDIAHGRQKMLDQFNGSEVVGGPNINDAIRDVEKLVRENGTMVYSLKAQPVKSESGMTAYSFETPLINIKIILGTSIQQFNARAGMNDKDIPDVAIALGALGKLKTKE